eukprot:6294430-Amphidinium_carterae.1
MLWEPNPAVKESKHVKKTDDNKCYSTSSLPLLHPLVLAGLGRYLFRRLVAELGKVKEQSRQ